MAALRGTDEDEEEPKEEEKEQVEEEDYAFPTTPGNSNIGHVS